MTDLLLVSWRWKLAQPIAFTDRTEDDRHWEVCLKLGGTTVPALSQCAHRFVS
jgi:hypothetical protein